MLRVGLTGGIACGKSRVLRRLAAAGLAVVDLDDLARAAMAPGGAAFGSVIEAFGRSVLGRSGMIDRGALARLVFADGAARARLEAVVHPIVRAEESRIAREAEVGHSVMVTDAALLVEAGAHLRFSRLIVVHCPEDVQLERLIRRDGLAENEARARITAQMPVGEKRQFGHFRIDTGGSLAETDRAADELAVALLALEEREARPRAPIAATTVMRCLGAGGRRGPRGLDGERLLRHALDHGELDLRRLAEWMGGTATTPWYRQADAAGGGPWPEALAVALALWALYRKRDEEWSNLASLSLAWLTHQDPVSLAGAVLAASAARAVAEGSPWSSVWAGLPIWRATARRWGGADPPDRVVAAVAAAQQAAGDAGVAWQRAEATGAEPAFASSLAVLAVPGDDSALRGDTDDLARRLAG